jgi:hypothetical protein
MPTSLPAQPLRAMAARRTKPAKPRARKRVTEAPQPDLRETVARLAALDPADPATPIEMAGAAKAHGTTAAALRQAVVLARQRAEAAGPPPNLGEMPPGSEADALSGSGKQMTAEEREAAIADLAALPKPEYAAWRMNAALSRLGFTRMSDLDKAVAAARARRRAEAEAEARNRPDPAPGEMIWPPGIISRPDGLYADAGGDAGPLWLAAPFEVMGEARNAASEAWGLYLRWRDRDGSLHVWSMPARLLMAEPGALEAELMTRGLRLSVDPAARLRLRMALAEVRAGSRVRIAYRAGWQDATGTAFLLPDGEVIGATAEAVVLDNRLEDASRLCATAGTLAGW